jgi:hypothetical protein
MEETSKHVVKGKRPVCKGHTLPDGTSMTFWKRKTGETVVRPVVARREPGRGETGGTQRTFRAVTLCHTMMVDTEHKAVVKPPKN